MKGGAYNPVRVTRRFRVSVCHCAWTLEEWVVDWDYFRHSAKPQSFDTSSLSSASPPRIIYPNIHTGPRSIRTKQALSADVFRAWLGMKFTLSYLWSRCLRKERQRTLFVKYKGLVYWDTEAVWHPLPFSVSNCNSRDSLILNFRWDHDCIPCVPHLSLASGIQGTSTSMRTVSFPVFHEVCYVHIPSNCLRQRKVHTVQR